MNKFIWKGEILGAEKAMQEINESHGFYNTFFDFPD